MKGAYWKFRHTKNETKFQYYTSKQKFKFDHIVKFQHNVHV